MLRPWVFVGFTGHRNLSNPELIARSLGEALGRIATRTGSPLAAVSSAAIGADTLFVKAVQQRAIPWILLLPFPPEIFANEQDFPTEADRAAFWKLAESAVHTHTNPGFKTEQPTTDSRENGFLECGLRTVEECDVLVAVWDGLEPRGLGGTGRIVAYAHKLKKPVLWIHAATGKLTEERFDLLKPDPATVPPATGREPLSTSEQLRQTFAYFDRHAETSAPFAKYLNISVVALHQLSIAIAIAGLIWVAFGPAASLIKIAALALALLLPWYFHHRQSAWMDNRLRAELCRSAQAIWNLRQHEHIFPALRLPVFESFQRSLLLLRLSAPKSVSDIEPAKAEYAEARIQNQTDYYTRHARKAQKHRRWVKGLSYTCTGLAILYGIIVTLHWLPATDTAYHAVKALSLTLPLGAAALVAAITAQDMDRRAARYTEMAKALASAKVRLEARTTWEGVATVVIEVERMLLLEIWEWYSVSRYSGSH
ncbi:MAG: hypothetical protein KIT44_04360 [Opitutaceae bacterium]|nr:hypothetical protein [Opitutaceae bacterium]